MFTDKSTAKLLIIGGDIMKDIVDSIDNIDENIENAEKEKRIRRESRKLLEEKRIKEKKTEFQVKFEKLKNDPIVQEHLLGKFRNMNSTTGDRINTNKLIIETLHRLSKSGEIPRGHELYISDKYYNGSMPWQKGGRRI